MLLKSIDSIQLSSSVPKVHEVFFDRDLIAGSEAEIKIELQTEFCQDDDENPKKLKLTFQVISYAQKDEDTFSFKSKIEVDYHFKIVDIEAYNEMDRESCISLCANITFLDFRRRLVSVYSSIGMQGVKLPMSLAKFSGDI